MKFGGETLSPEAAAICQALLDHQRALARAKNKLPFQDCLITYRDLCDEAGLPMLTEVVNGCLWEIAEFCAENEWPPLNSLVVNARSHEPHRSYDRCPGCSLKNWRDEAQRCLDFLYYPDLVKA
ncbi:MAG TPA: hypothetical protein VJS69_00835 [Candidatus Krumholzibacteria bacterium]|nr:hypothetical protein [Candidatus Krumholzibacteria bacterium]